MEGRVTSISYRVNVFRALGVMDEELNIIIEPIYYGIFWHDGYYDVENFDQESAHFSSTGEQTTDFKPS